MGFSYGTNGLVLFTSRLQVLNAKPDLPPEIALAAHLAMSAWPSFEFKRVSADRIAFVENYSGAEMVYPPFMHGYLLFNPAEREIEVVGLMNHFAVAVLVTIITAVIVLELTFGLMLVAFLIICYAAQARRYKEILSAAAVEWSQTDSSSGANKTMEPTR